MSELTDFRGETRAWLEENCPDGARGPGQVAWGSSKIELQPDTRRWLERMAERGWTVPTWPRVYGGAELTRQHYQVLIEELKRLGARTPLTGRGVNYIGPTLLELGSDSQKARWLPGIARGAGGWAMGYSEPGAGSDLASLSTRAVLEGDRYIINGRKTWTSDAMDCDYIFVLARTDRDRPKHQGISLILVDMDQPGVQVNPIRLISGASPFNETVFENAVAGAGDAVGGVNNGWTVGKRLLQFERSTHAGINISGSQGGRTARSRMPEQIGRYVPRMGSKLADPDIRDRLIRYEQHGLAQQREVVPPEYRGRQVVDVGIDVHRCVEERRGESGEVERRGSGDNRVELGRIALGEDQPLAAPVRTACEIGALGRRRVVHRRDVLRYLRDPVHGEVAVVDDALEVVERPGSVGAGAPVAGIGSRRGVAALERAR